MAGTLKGKKIAILATDGFEQAELTQPRDALKKAGAKTHIVSPSGGTIKGWNHKKWGGSFKSDRSLKKAKPDSYDGLLLPGGVMNPDKLRMDPAAIAFIKHFIDNGKPIAAICHGPWTLIETGVVKGLTLTSWPSLKTDIRNAGGVWVDEEVIVDQGIITSRKPDDIPAFNAAMIAEFGRARPEQSTPRRKAA